MDTRTGALRELEPDEQLPHVEDVREQLEADPGAPISPEVEVPPEYQQLPPDIRLAMMLGSRGGKDRKASRTPKKTDRQRRRERAARRKASGQRGRH